MRRLLSLTSLALRDPTYWRVSLLMFLVLVFSLTSGVVRTGGTSPSAVVENVLSHTVARVVHAAYPLLFPLLSILATLAIVAERESGGLASLQALGFRRWEIAIALTSSVVVLSLVPAMAAMLVLPPLVEPRLAAQGSVGGLYPLGYWLSMPRLLLAIVFLTLFASAFALVFRRAVIAFGAMIGFFFVGWSLDSALGLYGVLAPSGAFSTAYGSFIPLPGVPFDPNFTFLLYIGGGLVVFVAALLHFSWRGELQ